MKIPKVHAYASKILRVDLSSGKIATEPTMKYVKRFLGGRGINQWILYKEVKPGISPFDPANVLIFGTGVLVGTAAPAACRCTVDSKNVFTGGVGSANSGGHFGPELKFAGYDHVVIQGRSRLPCYLWIDDDKVETKNAQHLWGKTTWENDDTIREELGDDDIQIASIGPAGENLVSAACIINNGARAAARCGLGAVMGSKNLKAIAVRGTGEISVAKPEKFMQLVEELLEKIINNDCMKDYIKWGTTFLPKIYNDSGNSAVRNFQDGYWEPEKLEKISEEKIDKFSKGRLSCFGCPIGGSHYFKVDSGKFRGTEGEGFEYNSLSNFGCRVDVDYLPAIIKAHVLCSQYGLDVDNASGAIAWAMECYERGILKKEDVDGLNLEWGNYDAVLELLEKIALRKGFGDLLAEGSKKASQKVGKGSEKYSMNVKGQELWESLRASKGWSLGTIVSPRGGGHLRGNPLTEFLKISPEEGERIFGVSTAGDGKAYEGKAKLVIYFENFKAVVDCLNICYIVTQWSSPDLLDLEDLAKMLSLATGRQTTVAELITIGERVHNVEKAFNVREGMTRKDDMPPERFFAEPIKSGPEKGERLQKDKFGKMLDEYYELRGWDKDTGLPTKAKLEELDLGEIADELDKLNKLM